MDLTPQEDFYSNKLRTYIQENFNILENKNIKFCPVCQGTGLSVGKGISITWTGGYCSTCRGVGYVEWDNDESSFLCTYCNGRGISAKMKCKKCDGNGTIDWIQHAKGCL